MKKPSGAKIINQNQTAAEPQLNYQKVFFKDALKFWLWLGFVSFGGPAGQIAIMHRELVERKKWISEESFLHALNFCMLLPGPEAQQLATYSGWRLHGIRGGVVAGTLFVLPAVFILLALSYLYAAYGNLPAFAGVLNGLKAIVLAIVVEAVFKIATKALRKWQNWTVAATAFIAIYFFNIPFPAVVIGAALIGFVSSKIQNPKFKVENAKPTTVTNYQSKIQNPKFKMVKIFAVFAGLWSVPLIACDLVFGWQSLPVKICLFFTQAAFVTFGGAYAVLAYVNQIVVNSYGWIQPQQAIDGFALAETTPGPLIMVLQNIGFLAGWNNPQTGFNQTAFAVVCALLATFATFLPSFLFILAFAPFVERLQDNLQLKSALSTVTAAVVGAILTLALSFGATIIFHDKGFDWFAIATAITAFILLTQFKINVFWLILAGGLLGFLKVL